MLFSAAHILSFEFFTRSIDCLERNKPHKISTILATARLWIDTVSTTWPAAYYRRGTFSATFHIAKGCMLSQTAVASGLIYRWINILIRHLERRHTNRGTQANTQPPYPLLIGCVCAWFLSCCCDWFPVICSIYGFSRRLLYLWFADAFVHVPVVGVRSEWKK